MVGRGVSKRLNREYMRLKRKADKSETVQREPKSLETLDVTVPVEQKEQGTPDPIVFEKPSDQTFIPLPKNWLEGIGIDWSVLTCSLLVLASAVAFVVTCMLEWIVSTWAVPLVLVSAVFLFYGTVREKSRVEK